MFRTQEKLKCFKCCNIPSEFVVLNCYHLLCQNCLVKCNPKNKEITIVCSCGSETLLQGNNHNIVRSQNKAEISQFSLSNQSSPKLMYQDMTKQRKNLRESINEQTVDHTFSNLHDQSKRRKDSSKKLIKEIGCFTRSPLSKLDTQYTQDSQQFKNTDSQLNIQTAFKKQIKYLELQYDKSITDLKDILETKMEEFTRIFNDCKRNIRLWYSELISDSHSKINLAQYAKNRFQPITKELDRLQSQIHCFQINISYKPTCLSPQHRRMKTQTFEITTEIYVPKYSHHSPSYQRHRSPQFICPHASLALQKHKFIKKKYSGLDQFI